LQELYCAALIPYFLLAIIAIMSRGFRDTSWHYGNN